MAILDFSENPSPVRPALATSSIRVCVIGVGFVGQSLLRNFGAHFPCIGYDTSSEQIASLVASQTFSHLPHQVHLTASPSRLAQGTHFLIAVPTPIRDDYSVNLDSVHAALRTVISYASPGSVIVIESSVPVGTTRRLLAEYSQLYHVGMSPERIDPGRVSPQTHEIPKIVSALENPSVPFSAIEKSLQKITSLYATAFTSVVPVSSPEVAEMTKLYENCYRMVNIAYVNEIADACGQHGIDAHEVVRAAATKPFGFQPFTPGIGVGGHCIPVNPFYLFANCNLPLLQQAAGTMTKRPERLAGLFYDECLKTAAGRKSSDPVDPGAKMGLRPRILVVGMAFKPGQSDVSGSPALAFAKALRKFSCARLAFYDPLISGEKISWLEKLHRHHWDHEYLAREFDGIALCVSQEGVDFAVVAGLDDVFVQSYIAFRAEGQTGKHSNTVFKGENATTEQKSPGRDLRVTTKLPELVTTAQVEVGAGGLLTPPSSALLKPAEMVAVAEVELDEEELLATPPEAHIGLGVDAVGFPFGSPFGAFVGQVQMA